MKNLLFLLSALMIMNGKQPDPSEVTKVHEKTQDERLLLNDIWVVQSMHGESIGTGMDTCPAPRLEIRAEEMKYTGNDGCNNFFGGIIELDETNLRFGIGAGTRKMCQNMEISDQFNETLPMVTGYKVRNMVLYLFDEEGNELMQLKKVD